MRKLFIIGMAIVVSMVFVPTAPAQVPGAVTQVLCTVGADGLLGGAVEGTHTGTSTYNDPGSAPNVHVFAFCGAAGDDVDFFVDNVDTPSDVWACVTAAPNDACAPPACCETNLFNLGGDDEVPCTVPHAYACPAGIAPLPADNGDGVYFIRVGSWPGSWSTPGGYAGYVKLNGEEVPVLLQ